MKSPQLLSLAGPGTMFAAAALASALRGGSLPATSQTDRAKGWR